MSRTSYLSVRVGRGFIVLTVVLAGLSIPGHGLAQSGSLIESGRQNCLMVLGERVPGAGYNEIESFACFSSEKERGKSLAPQLVKLYEHADYGGAVLEVEAKSGACDSEGYGIRTMPSGWDNRVSSFSFPPSGGCNASEAFENPNYGGFSQTYSGSGISWVGSKMNDQISSIRMWKS